MISTSQCEMRTMDKCSTSYRLQPCGQLPHRAAVFQQLRRGGAQRRCSMTGASLRSCHQQTCRVLCEHPRATNHD